MIGINDIELMDDAIPEIDWEKDEIRGRNNRITSARNRNAQRSYPRIGAIGNPVFIRQNAKAAAPPITTP